MPQLLIGQLSINETASCYLGSVGTVKLKQYWESIEGTGVGIW